jgi:hypothetical protein
LPENAAVVRDVFAGPADEEALAWILEVAEILSGYVVDAMESSTPKLVPIETAEWNERMRRFRQRLVDGADNPFCALGRWVLSDPWYRRRSPLSRVTVPQHLRELAASHYARQMAGRASRLLRASGSERTHRVVVTVQRWSSHVRRLEQGKGTRPRQGKVPATFSV